MKRADRLARSGAVTRGAFTAGETIRRERPFGLTLLGIIVAVITVLVLSRACASMPVSALVVSPVPAATGSPSLAGSSPRGEGRDHELLMPLISQRWPPAPVISTCTSEDLSCK